VRFRVAEVEGIHDESNVRRVFSRVGEVRNLDELEPGFMQGPSGSFVALPVGIGLFHHDFALMQEAL
jgi:hypothetical protein